MVVWIDGSTAASRRRKKRGETEGGGPERPYGPGRHRGIGTIGGRGDGGAALHSCREGAQCDGSMRTRIPGGASNVDWWLDREFPRENNVAVNMQNAGGFVNCIPCGNRIRTRVTPVSVPPGAAG